MDYDNTLVEYEEDGAGSRVYKFDASSGEESAWTETGSGAFFRRVGERLQVYRVRETVDATDVADLVAFLRTLSPVLDEAVLEVWIGQSEGRYFLRDYAFETDGPVVAELPALTPGAFASACQHIREQNASS